MNRYRLIWRKEPLPILFLLPAPILFGDCDKGAFYFQWLDYQLGVGW